MSRYSYRHTPGGKPCREKNGYGFECFGPGKFAVIGGALREGNIPSYVTVCAAHLSKVAMRLSGNGNKYVSVVPLAHLVVGKEA